MNNTPLYNILFFILCALLLVGLQGCSAQTGKELTEAESVELARQFVQQQVKFTTQNATQVVKEVTIIVFPPSKNEQGNYVIPLAAVSSMNISNQTKRAGLLVTVDPKKHTIIDLQKTVANN
jgi:hypothetical protein